MQFTEPLPIDDVLANLAATLAHRASAVLVAPPGAGKTTRVPLALMDEPWARSGKILVLEPRRLAARGAAERMARTLGEAVGGRIGLRARLATKVGPATRVEVVTEGVFTRMILDDPGLDGIAAVLFDEFHERSLEADAGLAFALDCQRALRPDLRLVVMSATLEGARVAALLGEAPVITSEGRIFPVVTRYLGRDARARIEDEMTDAIATALRAEQGSILAFLPGQGEIRRVADRLAERIKDPDVLVAPLYGAMDSAAQDRAIAPAAPGVRKVVLASAIAETSLTIEGVRVVIDSGLARVPRYEPSVGVTRLETVRVSRASADQRRGRAGRLEPGICYRLWSEPETQSLLPYAEPEIRAADLGALLLDCAEWGVSDPTNLSWLDPPRAAALDAARRELRELGALDQDGRMTPLGRRMRALPLPPRVARMVLAAAAAGTAEDASEIAAILVERGLGGAETDLVHRLQAFRRDRSRRAVDMRRLAGEWARLAMKLTRTEPADRVLAAEPDARASAVTSPAYLLALAYPQRIAKPRGAPGQLLLASGRGATLEATDPLARAPYLVVAEMQGAAVSARVLLAAALDESELLDVAGDRIVARDELSFDSAAAALRARRVRRLGAIELTAEPISVPAGEEAAQRLAEGIARIGIDRLAWSKAQLQLRDRVAFLRQAEGEAWPDLSDQALARRAGEWLAPYLAGKTRLAEISADDLGQMLDAIMPWDIRRRLDVDAPTHFEAPTGNRFAVDYQGPGAPAVHVRVQELFGLAEHPAIAGGRLPLTLHLLSPAHRPIQITRDLPGFWTGSWSAVRAEMRGRYPKHVWPEDPAHATPTARAKPRAR